MSKPIYLYITPFFPSPESWRGGFCLDAVKALMRDGRYRVIVMKPGKGADYEYEGIRIYRFQRRSFPSGLAPFLLADLNERYFLRKLADMGVSPDTVSVCHVHSYEYSYAIALKKINRSVIAITQTHRMGAPFVVESGRLGVVPIHANFLYSYYKRLLEAADIVIVLSRLHLRQFGLAYPFGPLGAAVDIRERLLFGRYYKCIHPKKVRVLYNGIDTKVFSRREGQLERACFTIGCVANFLKSKDQMTLLKAIDVLVNQKRITYLDGRRLHVRLVGSGPMLNDCKAYVADKNLSDFVSFEKEVEHLSLPAFYRSLDLFVLPTWQEGFCCAMIEAAGCGVPVMSCRGVSIEEVISETDRDKWLIQPKDFVDLGEKIVRYAKEKNKFHFARNLEINGIWKEFLDEIEK